MQLQLLLDEAPVPATKLGYRVDTKKMQVDVVEFVPINGLMVYCLNQKDGSPSTKLMAVLGKDIFLTKDAAIDAAINGIEIRLSTLRKKAEHLESTLKKVESIRK